MINYSAIAREAGVSKATVSRVFNNYPWVTEEKKRRVLECAARLGYRPNPLVQVHMASLRSRKPEEESLTMALVGEDRGGWMEDPSIKPVLAGAFRRARERGYKFDLFDLSEKGMTSRRIGQILHSRNIRGALIPPLSPRSGMQKDLDFDWENIAWATASYSVRSPNLHRACCDLFNGLHIVIRKLLEKGYRRIGLALTQSHDERVNHLWTGSYEAFRLMEGERLLPPHVSRGGKREFLDWVGEAKPDVVMSSWEETLKFLESAGYSIPGDLSWADLHRLEHQERHAGLCQNFEQLGASAVDLIVAQLHQNEYGLPKQPKTVLTQAYWVEGETVGDVRSVRRATKAERG